MPVSQWCSVWEAGPAYGIEMGKNIYEGGGGGGTTVSSEAQMNIKEISLTGQIASIFAVYTLSSSS